MAEDRDDAWDDGFDPSSATRGVLRWALETGASTLGEAFDMLDQFEASNDVPEVLGHDDSVDEVRAELEEGLAAVGPDVDLAALV